MGDEKGGMSGGADGPDLVRATRDLLYTAIGLGVLGIQQIQVRRREVERCLARMRATLPADPGHAGEEPAASR